MTEDADKTESFWSANKPAFLALVGLVLVHGICLRNGFVDFDDDTIFLANQHFALSLPEFIAWSFDLERPDTWRPIRDLSHYLDLQIHGQSPLWAHAHNLTLLVLAAGLTMALFRVLGVSSATAAVAAFIGYAHPVQVEVITWVSGRKDLLAASLCLCTLLVFIRYVRSASGHGMAILVVVLSALGVMAKGHLIVMPVLLVWIYLRLRAEGHAQEDKSWFSVGILLSILSLAALFIAPRIASGGVALPAELQREPTQSILLGDKLQLPLRYLGKIAWPADLNHIYFTPRLDIWHTPMAIVSMALAVLLLWLIYEGVRKNDIRGHALAVACTLMAPYMHLRTGVVYMADRYLFLSLPFLALVFVLTVKDFKWWIERADKIKMVLLTLLFTLMVAGSLRPHSAFQDSPALWTRMTEVYPDSAWGYDRLGRALYHAKQYPAAAGAWLRAAERQPQAMRHLNNAAVAAMAVGRNKMATQLLLRVLKVEPTNILALRNLKIMRGSMDDSDKASLENSGLPVEEPTKKR